VLAEVQERGEHYHPLIEREFAVATQREINPY
jgi:hypothetical protein